MSVAIVALTLLSAALVIMGGYLWLVTQHRKNISFSMNSSKLNHRKLNPLERAAIDKYLQYNEKREQQSITRRSHLLLPNDTLTLTAKSNDVYTLTQAITRYGLAGDENKYRYFIESTEIHLPAFWEQYIGKENHVELINTQTHPLVISLNGYSLVSHVYDRTPEPPPIFGNTAQNSSIRQEESEHIELIKIRQESREEHMLTQSSGIHEALAISLFSFLLLVTLIGPVMLLPWTIALMLVILGWLAWRIIPEYLGKNRREIHCLRGMPKRWSLFGESNQGDIGNISLGAVDLNYPPHWQPYITRELGQKTEVDIYLNSQVVRQGRYLSLHDEVKNFPLQLWGRNLILACSSLLLLVMLLVYAPLALPLKLSMTWFQGAQNTEVSNLQSLETTPLHVGDSLKVQGTGMCFVPGLSAGAATSAFTPFDCSAIYWNDAAPLSVPESNVINKANSLLATINAQLHPPRNNEQNLNPQLATAIEKSGMILLDNFSEIVLKTEALCSNTDDCVRLKNALVNLGNADNWSSLVKRARSGTLQGMNVLLRPVSAQSLSDLVNNAVANFFSQETHKAAEILNTPPKGGFLIVNDEGKQLVSHAAPALSLFAYSPFEQWKQLQNLSAMLLHTSFAAQGVITSINVDTNGVRRITLHNAPDMVSQWRYLGISLLFFALIASIGVNSVLLFKRRQQDKRRLQEIQTYYNHCFNPTFTDNPLRPMR
jgi:hypothetical protein